MARETGLVLVKEFYKKLGAKGLSSLTNRKRDISVVQFVSKFIKKKDKILDLACGYGRITLPLKKKGFDICGIDISKNLIEYARNKSKKEKLQINFKTGDMRRLPYKHESFNKVLCLWSSFNHLLTKKEQLKAINEIYRILKTKGACMIDLPNGESKWAKKNITEKKRTPIENINNLKVRNYIHNKKSLADLARKSNFKDYKIKFANIGGRRRLIFILKKR